ncbi:MAG: polyprenyl synthetase family protein [Rhodoluna sp.]|nr:polyprenyl synthetase family protein [Rhodoluna sp.]
MSESTILLNAIQKQLDDFCASRRRDFGLISEDLYPLVDFAEDLLQGGKRFRAQFCYWSWAGNLASNLQLTQKQRDQSLEAVVGICAALEMFHAAALVHDDLLDQSDTRRGKPAVHKNFESLHAKEDWAGSKERFGQAGSVLVGDLMLSWSSEIFGNALLHAPTPEIEQACREEFSRMRVEIMAGQYLDVLEENAAPSRNPSEAVARANRVMLYKTAKYSIEAPLLIGAAFAGASQAERNALGAFAIPLGLAFQLRDDVLGVFGDPQVTGKPAGDDLREGKRTVLVGLTRETLDGAVGRVFDEMLTSRELSDDQIRFLQQTIVGCGALKKTEELIETLGTESMQLLEKIQLESEAKDALRQLALLVINRSH